MNRNMMWSGIAMLLFELLGVCGYYLFSTYDLSWPQITNGAIALIVFGSFNLVALFFIVRGSK